MSELLHLNSWKHVQYAHQKSDAFRFIHTPNVTDVISDAVRYTGAKELQSERGYILDSLDTYVNPHGYKTNGDGACDYLELVGGYNFRYNPKASGTATHLCTYISVASGAASSQLNLFLNVATEQFFVYFFSNASSGSIGNTTVATGVSAPSSIDLYIEFEILFSSTAGYFRIYINDSQVVNYNNVTCASLLETTDASIPRIVVGDPIAFNSPYPEGGTFSGSNTLYPDFFFIGDSYFLRNTSTRLGPANTPNFIRPIADGTYSDSAIIGAEVTRFESVNDSVPDQDTTALLVDAVDQKNTFYFQGIGAEDETEFAGIQLVIRAKTIGADIEIVPYLIIGGVEYDAEQDVNSPVRLFQLDSATNDDPDQYVTYTMPINFNPATGLSFTGADLNDDNLQIGFRAKTVPGGASAHITQFGYETVKFADDGIPGGGDPPDPPAPNPQRVKMYLDGL